jgi:uncharacterized membrane protein
MMMMMMTSNVISPPLIATATTTTNNNNNINNNRSLSGFHIRAAKQHVNATKVTSSSFQSVNSIVHSPVQQVKASLIGSSKEQKKRMVMMLITSNKTRRKISFRSKVVLNSSSLKNTGNNSESNNEAPSVSIKAENDGKSAFRTTTTTETPTPTPNELIPRPPLKVAAAFAFAGSLESTYLAIQKLSGGDVVCPVGGCQTALNSSYAELFGQPLSLYGAVAYFIVALIAFSGSSVNPEESKELESKYKNLRVLFFLSTCGLAGVSSYLLYVLAIKLGGVECVYCLTSASISFALFSIGFSGLTPKETLNASPPAISLFVVTMLSLYLVLGSGADNTDDRAESQFLSYQAPRIETVSTQYSRELAKYLKVSGAKMYGAFWCSHCLDQKEEFGKDTELPYVECFPEGWQKGAEIAKACSDAKVKGFPTWVINGKAIEGDKTLDELAKESGFRTETPIEFPLGTTSIPDFLQ